MGVGEAVRYWALVLLLGCDPSPAPPAGAAATFVDSRGKAVRVPSPPRRIVSVVPSATELLFAVGAGDQVVGVTTSCDYPAEAKAKPKVGGLVVDYELLAALRPDLVVTSESLIRHTTADLEGRGLAVFSVDPANFEGIADALRLLGEVTGHAAKGKAAAEELLRRVRAAEAGGAGPTFYFEHSSDPIGTTGPESYAGDALRRAGGRNVFEGGWKNIDWEHVLARDPEVILIAHDRRADLERREGWSKLKAVRAGRVHFVAKEGFVFPTPRLVGGLEESARIFHAKSP